MKKARYTPWKQHYIDYNKLKELLKEHDGEQSDDAVQWTEEDEEAFVKELLNVQLDKVNAFQVETYKTLRERTSECEANLEPLVVKGDRPTTKSEQEAKSIAEKGLAALDSISKDINRLERFSRINFTGFLKAAKKHDRKRGAQYKVRPLLQVRLSQLPFNSEDYSPLLYRLSTMYAFVQQTLGGIPAPRPNISSGAVDLPIGKDQSSSFKFWVHIDNLLEVKTHILRYLPVLVYNPGVSKDLDFTRTEPSMTSLYFDSPSFMLYNGYVNRSPDASSVRLRWTGQLNEDPQIFVEKWIVGEDERDGNGIKMPIKAKHINAFLNGDYKMEKTVNQRESASHDHDGAESLKRGVADLQEFIKENELQPVLRASYNRTAFQIPGDNRVRMSVDTDICLIREDALDPNQPCRDPNNWHRTDIDDGEMQFPFSDIPPNEISRFPHALLEIKIRGDASKASKEWVTDLMTSHLLKESPRFSKFAHGVAQLFEDHVNTFPFWLSDMDIDIHRDPETAFNEERERLARRAEDELAVGSFYGSLRSSYLHPPSGVSPVAARGMLPWASGSPGKQLPTPEMSGAKIGPTGTDEERTSHDGGGHGEQPAARPSRRSPEADANSPAPTGPSTRREPPLMSSLRRYFDRFPGWRRRTEEADGTTRDLPPSVRRPREWIKDQGPVKVEAKVWLANQRTFIKWQHMAVLLASLAIGLYNAATTASARGISISGATATSWNKDGGNDGGSYDFDRDNRLARVLAVAYMIFALFAGAWGWSMYLWRAEHIRRRSGRDFDNVLGPMIVCLGLAVALVMNFWLKVCLLASYVLFHCWLFILTIRCSLRRFGKSVNGIIHNRLLYHRRRMSHGSWLIRQVARLMVDSKSHVFCPVYFACNTYDETWEQLYLSYTLSLLPRWKSEKYCTIKYVVKCKQHYNANQL